MNSEQIQRQIKEFEASGGSINIIPTGLGKDTPKNDFTSRAQRKRISKWAERRETAFNEALTYVQGHPGCSKTEIRKAIKSSYKGTQEILNSLLQKRLVYGHGHPRIVYSAYIK